METFYGRDPPELAAPNSVGILVNLGNVITLLRKDLNWGAKHIARARNSHPLSSKQSSLCAELILCSMPIQKLLTRKQPWVFTILYLHHTKRAVPERGNHMSYIYRAEILNHMSSIQGLPLHDNFEFSTLLRGH